MTSAGYLVVARPGGKRKLEDSTSSTNEKKRKRRNLGDELEKLHSRISAIQKACIDGLLQRLNKEDDREREKKRIESEFEPLYRQIDDLKRMEEEIQWNLDSTSPLSTSPA